MPSHINIIRTFLAKWLPSALKLAENIGISQPKIARALAGLENKIMRIGAARSIQPAIRAVYRRPETSH